MTTPLSFHSEIRNTGITAYRVYVAEVSVSAPYALHIEFDGAAQASPVALLVEQKTDGTNYVTADSLAQSLIKGRRYVYDHDFPGEAWPKQVRITSPMPVLTGSVTTGGGGGGGGGVIPDDMEQRIADLEAKSTTQQQILSTEDADGNGIPDGEDRLRIIEGGIMDGEEMKKAANEVFGTSKQ